jgi:hypothetical protein
LFVGAEWQWNPQGCSLAFKVDDNPFALQQIEGGCRIIHRFEGEDILLGSVADDGSFEDRLLIAVDGAIRNQNYMRKRSPDGANSFAHYRASAITGPRKMSARILPETAATGAGDTHAYLFHRFTLSAVTTRMALVTVNAVVHVPVYVRVLEIARVIVAMADRALEDRVVTAIGVTRGALAVCIAVVGREACVLRVIECGSSPCARGVAGRALR